MQVVLLQDVVKLGKKGDIVNVSEGYARNFLYPKNLAAPATESKLKELKTQKQTQAAKKQKEEAEAKALAAKINGLTVALKVKVGDAGRLFGAISNKDIADGLKSQHGYSIDKKKIVLKEPIKNLGTYKITLKIHPVAQADINVEVASMD
ncbi:LSU ribosomal protein L9P [Desulforamulus reducens MI-1]|uniref:Large ribosomal subunit protein bL9 n=1 Tax=Desulforamulus reducens (strain ATCC BAA-1160 / DSM 100696 / MI-1) TaxID=349161 RepID=RL9_DESRM|nr:50S ribosomal protein L9 [Desulforamulus reducens]A4J9Q0.1 RecName: Full=Large ribosomal subunit protein bL9; AltName: Full=50S ribosomal protein L9 [Desulforamulus reducens MI-1]ABO51803.1 LSU ribosomal protein L9P [Desulforamulus reducens MI-1]